MEKRIGVGKFHLRAFSGDQNVWLKTFVLLQEPHMLTRRIGELQGGRQASHRRQPNHDVSGIRFAASRCSLGKLYAPADGHVLRRDAYVSAKKQTGTDCHRDTNESLGHPHGQKRIPMLTLIWSAVRLPLRISHVRIRRYSVENKMSERGR